MITSRFTPQTRLTDRAKEILRQRYLQNGETKWKQLVHRVVEYVCEDWLGKDKEIMYSILYNRYGLPNTPALANLGAPGGTNGGLACFVLPFEDDTYKIFNTKRDFALIARKGGGAGTTLTNIRPKGGFVNGSSHGYAGGPIAFANTISVDMQAFTQGGLRSMALMFTMSVYHPDILEFIDCKSNEGIISNANISVVVDDDFMRKVQNNETFWTEFDGKKYEKLSAVTVFNKIVDGMWRNGEPGLLFHTEVNNGPYKHAGLEIQATNPCGEIPAPPNISCNLFSLDLSKFFRHNTFNWKLFEDAIRYSVRFQDSLIDKNEYPTDTIRDMAMKFRPIGLGPMGLADYYLKREIPYGSKKALSELDKLGEFMSKIANDESEKLGTLLGVPEGCKSLPTPRRNITTTMVAPTGSVSILAGCNSSIEPYFSEITQRTDKTGTYTIDAEHSDKPYFRCAVPSDGDKRKEVSWDEHVLTQATLQRHFNSGISKTINFPTKTRRETIAKALLLAWEKRCKGITVYRNGSRKEQVLTPKNLKKELCPACKATIERREGCWACTECEWSLCTL